MEENRDKCFGCNCFIKKEYKPSPRNVRICKLVKRKYFKFISERCPCQECLVKVTCKVQTSERYFMPGRDYCNKFGYHFHDTFRWGIVKKNNFRTKDWVVPDRVRKAIKYKELKEQDEKDRLLNLNSSIMESSRKRKRDTKCRKK